MRRGGLGSVASRLGRTAPDAAAGPAAPPPALKHCWVLGPQGRLPGLLLGWEQRDDGWYGRVVHPELDAQGWAVVEQWLPARSLEAAVASETPPQR